MKNFTLQIGLIRTCFRGINSRATFCYLYLCISKNFRRKFSLNWNLKPYGRTEHIRKIHSFKSLKKLIIDIPMVRSASLEGDDLIALNNSIVSFPQGKVNIKHFLSFIIEINSRNWDSEHEFILSWDRCGQHKLIYSNIDCIKWPYYFSFCESTDHDVHKNATKSYDSDKGAASPCECPILWFIVVSQKLRSGKDIAF